jgi:hypothetical protein
MLYSLSLRILGRDPGDIPRMLSAVEEASKEFCGSASRGPSWVVLGCNEGLVCAQAEARAPKSLGDRAAIECLVKISSKDPSWIVTVLERIRAEASSLGYPLLLNLDLGESIRYHRSIF